MSAPECPHGIKVYADDLGGLWLCPADRGCLPEQVSDWHPAPRAAATAVSGVPAERRVVATLSEGLDVGIKGYTAWRKALWADEGLRALHAAKGSKNPPRWDARSVAEVIAMQGANGRGCFASSEYLAEILGCHRNTVDKARAELLSRGWFTLRGKGGSTGRALVLDLALPNCIAVQDNRTPVLANRTARDCGLPGTTYQDTAYQAVSLVKDEPPF